MSKKEQISIRVDRHLKDKLLIYANSDNKNLTDYITDILTVFVEKKYSEEPVRENLRDNEKTTEAIEQISERLENFIAVNNEKLSQNNTLINTDIAVMKNMQKVMAAFKENNKESFKKRYRRGIC